MSSKNFPELKDYVAQPDDIKNLDLIYNVIKNGHVGIFKDLVKFGLNPNITYSYYSDQQGYTLLHIAANHEQEEIASLLVSLGADLNAEDDKDHTPLHYAVEKRNMPIIQLFLSNKAQLKNVRSLLNESVRKNSMVKDFSILELLVDHGAHPDTLIQFGKPLLNLVLEFLHPVGFDPTTVTATIFRGINDVYLKVAKNLLKKGANPNISDDLYGHTPLHVAAKVGNPEAAILLIKYGVDINRKTIDTCQTPLHIGAANRHLEFVETLLVYGAEVNASDDEGRTPLHLAIGRNDMCVMVVYTLLKFGGDINAEDKFGDTVLDYVHQVEEETNEKITEVLINHLIKFQVAKRRISEKNKHFLVMNEKREKFKKLCEAEIEKMKGENVADTGVNFYKVLRSCQSRLVHHSRMCRNLMDTLKLGDFDKKFPIYSDFLAYKLRLIHERNGRIKKHSATLNCFFEKYCGLTIECADMILDYLNNRELEVLAEACNDFLQRSEAINDVNQDFKYKVRV